MAAAFYKYLSHYCSIGLKYIKFYVFLSYVHKSWQGPPHPQGGSVRNVTLKTPIFRLRLRRSFFTIRHYHVFNFGYSLFSFFLIDLWTEDHDEELSKRSCALSVCPLDTKPMVVFWSSFVSSWGPESGIYFETTLYVSTTDKQSSESGSN